jgi:hypothetical protein
MLLKEAARSGKSFPEEGCRPGRSFLHDEINASQLLSHYSQKSGNRDFSILAHHSTYACAVCCTRFWV